ncbi:MAG: phosphodiester glycosidase family protein [Clostridia bacterium]|nr:phosphodiester glycosidase family protein [Clostridia bacterium]
MKKRAVILVLIVALIAAFWGAWGVADEAGEVSADCEYRMPSDSDRAENLTDDNVLSRLTVRDTESVEILLPEEGADWLYIEWYTLPERVRITQRDGEDNELSREDLSPEKHLQTYRLSEGCREVSFRVTAGAVSTLRVYRGELLDTLIHYDEAADSKADIVLLLHSPEALFEDFSALLPLLEDQYDGEVAVVCVNAQRRDARRDLQEALWSLGIRSEPIFLNFTDNEYNELSDIEKNWGVAKTKERIQSLFTELEPEIVIASGSTEDMRAVFLKEQLDAVLAEGAEVTLYVADENGTKLNCEAYVEAAKQAYELMDSRRVFRIELSSTLGLTRLSGDAELTAKLATPTPEITPIITEEPTAQVAETELATSTAPSIQILEASPAETASASSAGTDGKTQRDEGEAFPILPLIIAAVAAVALLLIKRLRLRTRLIFGAVLIALAGLLCFALYSGWFEGESVVPSPTAELQPPTESPAAPTPSPTSVPTAEPTFTATPTPTEQPEVVEYELPYYVGEAGEEIIIDDENGRWSYRNADLAVEVERISTTVEQGGKELPLTYFVAHIYQRNYNSFRAAFASQYHNGVDCSTPEEMARRYRAVLWITGDNLINAEPEKKGILIRDGYSFYTTGREDAMVLNDDLTLSIYRHGEISRGAMIDAGVQESFSFGPTLVYDGEPAKLSRGTNRNPRCGLGMIEAGHFVAIVVDGRQDDYSVGLPLKDFAELFLQQGCTYAYNLDGGISTAIVFMGRTLNRHSGDREQSSWQRDVPEGLSWGYSLSVEPEQGGE